VSWLSWIGFSKPTLPDDLADSPLDWSADDVAVPRPPEPRWQCVASGLPMAGPAGGQRCRVVSVELTERRQFLRLAPFTGVFAAYDFDRVPPREREAEAKRVRRLFAKSRTKAPLVEPV
jgi:hypothetical protein